MKRLAPLTRLLCLSAIVGLSTFARPAHAVTTSFSVLVPGLGGGQFTCLNQIVLTSSQSNLLGVVWTGDTNGQMLFSKTFFFGGTPSFGGLLSGNYGNGINGEYYQRGAWNFHCDDGGTAAGGGTWHLHIDRSATL